MSRPQNTYTIETYNLDIENSKFVRTSVIQTHTNLELIERLNNISACRFSLNLNDTAAKPENFIPWRSQVVVKRNGSGIFVGPVSNFDYEYQGVEGFVNFEVLGYGAHLRYRFTDQSRIFDETEASTIATTLISDVQNRTNGELLIKNGSIDTVGNTSDTLEFTSIYNAIKNQTDNLVGYDFDFAPEFNNDNLLKQVNFNLYKSKGRFRNDNKKLELQDTISVSGSSNSKLINTITVLGQGTGEEVFKAEESIAALQKGYSRRENVVKRGREPSRRNLKNIATRYLQENSTLRQRFNLTLNPNSNFDYSSFETGDIIPIDIEIEDTFLRVKGNFRVLEKNVRLDEQGTEFITPKIEQV